MEQALEKIAELRQRHAKVCVSGHLEYNPGWHTAIDVGCMLNISEAITRCALERKESRGAQFREDFPQKSAECGTFNLIAKKAADGTMEVRRRPLVPTRPDLKAVIEKMK
jgi:succinate dehydrogenase / fumarate reductase flavoprotein subunit